MTAELLVNITPSETRVAYIDGGILQEIHIEREAKRGIVGNIYKGRVSRVLPGMQAAFVDIGLDKAAFLHASDIMPHTECVAGDEQKNFNVRDIAELVRQGQDLMVQVVKDPLGTKGARLTTDITLPSRYLVLMPGAAHVGVSQRIESEAERERLKRRWQLTVMSRAVLLFVLPLKGLAKKSYPPMPRSLNVCGPKFRSVRSVISPNISCMVKWRWRNAYCVILLVRRWIKSALTQN